MRSVVAAAATILVLSACSPDEAEQKKLDPPALTRITDPATVLSGKPADLAIKASAALFATSPVAVLADPDDPAALGLAASAGVGLGVPVLLTKAAAGALGAELDRLKTTSVVAFGAAASDAGGELGSRAVVPGPADAGSFQESLGLTASTVMVEAKGLQKGAAGLQAGPKLSVLEVTDAKPAAGAPAGGKTGEAKDAVLPSMPPRDGASDALVLVNQKGDDAAGAVATARAAGAQVLTVNSDDPRVDSDTVRAIHDHGDKPVIALGSGFGDDFADHLAVARTGVELPGGGQTVFPGRRFVALYGSPTGAALGVLGEQGVDAAIKRAKKVAKPYQEYSDVPVIPTFEIIATVASASAGEDGDYSFETPISQLEPWIEAAQKAGVYVVLDLQPGRTDFLTQAKRYEKLLKYPNVGLALDPEWRLKPNQKHLVQIGSVGIKEVNEVIDWVADLTRDNNLPQKVFTLHQFNLQMIKDREKVDTSRSEVALLLHADGNGTPGAKMGTWRALQKDLPQQVHMGWKNFYDEDSPTFTPKQTYELTPKPWFVSYQ